MKDSAAGTGPFHAKVIKLVEQEQISLSTQEDSSHGTLPVLLYVAYP